MKHLTPLATSFALALSLGLLSACATSVPQLRYQADSRVTVKDWEGGLKKYDAVLVQAPDDWAAHRGRGRCLLKMGKAQDAETSLRRALELVGHDSPASQGLCDEIAYAKMAQRDDAGLTSFLSEEVKRHGTSRDFLRQGRGLAFIGDADGAVGAFHKAEIRAWDEDDDARYATYLAIADFYGAMRDQPNQLRYTQFAAYVKPKMPESKKRLEKLGRVNGPTEWVPPPTKAELLGPETKVLETK